MVSEGHLDKTSQRVFAPAPLRPQSFSKEVLFMSEQAIGRKIEPCPASRDWAYITVNTVLWLLGAFGMFWMTDASPLNLVMPAAYLGLNFVFFWRVFGKAVCAHCAYHYPELPQAEYRSRFEARFVKALNRWYKVWILIGWAWPVATMTLIYLVSKKPLVLVSLLLFLLISFGVFLPVLRLRVCPRCKANELGICPFFPPRTFAGST